NDNPAAVRGQPLTTTAEELRAATATLNDHGIAVWRIWPGEKLPKDPAWTAREFDPRTFRDGHNIGALSGPQSDGRKPGRSLLWFDLETPEAVEVGDRVIPAAGSIIEGRPGNPRSHRGVWVADDSIPDFALFPEHEDTAVGLRARGYAGRLAGTLQARHLTRTHPGKKGQPVREMVVELFGTGRQVNVGPSVWVSKDGTRRERREVVQLPTPDEIVTYGYPDAAGWFEEITEKCGGEIISHCWKRTHIRVTGEPPKAKEPRVRDLKFPGIEPASLNGRHKAPGAGVASQGGFGSVVIRGVTFGLEERVNRFRAYLEKLSLTEWGDGGNQAFRVARVGANDMALDDQPHTVSWRPATAGDAEWMLGKSRDRLAPVLTGCSSWMPDRRAQRRGRPIQGRCRSTTAPPPVFSVRCETFVGWAALTPATHGRAVPQPDAAVARARDRGLTPTASAKTIGRRVPAASASDLDPPTQPGDASARRVMG
ncbi:MAG TPA: hypothetical protein VM597_13450, partial [Gemmataceae bacterium]|nr:hypothetical protein [Gemmataceae bacterium]